MVHYKGAGTRVLLRYYTRDSGGRVILARTEAAAVLSFKERLSEAQNIPRPLDFLRIELVAPSPSAVLRANKIRKLRLAENFLFAITWDPERWLLGGPGRALHQDHAAALRHPCPRSSISGLAAAGTLSRELGIPGNIFLRYEEARSGRVIAGNGIIRK
jgi:hypothetical protein